MNGGLANHTIPSQNPLQCFTPNQIDELGTLSTNTTGKLNILGHDSHTLCMDSTQVGILKESDKISLSSLLKSKYSGRLETKISLEVLCNLTDKTLEGSLTDKEISRLLILSNLS
jgi:hypothetical protein